MTRVERILAAYEGGLSAEELAGLGVTLADVDAAWSLTLLELELVRHVARLGDPDLTRTFVRPDPPG